MGFSKEIKEKVLVASARRCCVCKTFKGRDIEVHHIIPSYDGGPDTFENAIPLCFDCHSQAGHYNPNHSRGTKYSPNELRQHRDLWYDMVKQGIFSLNEIDISQQFYLTNSFDIVSELIKGDFTNFPINNAKLYKNELYIYLKEIDFFNNKSSDFYNYYESIEEYRHKFPDAIFNEDKYGSKYWSRIPSDLEIKDRFFNTEYIINYMMRNNVPCSEYLSVTISEYGCGDGDGVYESFCIQEPQVVFLAISNLSQKTLSIKNLTEIFINDGGLIKLSDNCQSARSKNTNNLQIESGSCLLIPYCILLSGLNDDYTSDKRLIYSHISTGQSQDVRHVELSDKNNSYTIGARNFITQIQLEQDNLLTDYSVKSIDPNNLLLISRFWECGSCPHLFGFKKITSKWEYICEVFNDTAGVTQEFVLNTKVYEFDILKIVELENEITEIESIIVDDIRIVNKLKLSKGEEYLLPINDATIIKIKGKFSLVEGQKYVHNANMKKQKIAFYIADN